ncbi:hypothetical protein THOM_0188 [Trachipleistophora hominis]|uniref:Uncharacterized protein n=1 Tax=Trachipleistophora hominis TaxID=72359 RepID=L7JZE6_TRAHO|nr:hypothetical protein THOM_0188 [Trachipleistophora hominis]
MLWLVVVSNYMWYVSTTGYKKRSCITIEEQPDSKPKLDDAMSPCSSLDSSPDYANRLHKNLGNTNSPDREQRTVDLIMQTKVTISMEIANMEDRIDNNLRKNAELIRKIYLTNIWRI